MTTLTKKDLTHDVGDPFKRTSFAPSVPAFMEARGVCAFLVREQGQPFWEERWTKTSGYITQADGAEHDEVLSYIDDPEIIDLFDDIPEPIACHDADLWDDCVEPDLDDYEFIARQHEQALRFVA